MLTNKYTAKQYSANQTLLNCLKAILADSGLFSQFWPEAVIYFAYTWNQIRHHNQNYIQTLSKENTCR